MDALPPNPPAVVSAVCPELQVRSVELGKRFFIVEYCVYRGSGFYAPATVDSQPHYPAQATVYELKGGVRVRLGRTFPASWIDQGCFEDDPATLVSEATRNFGKKSGKVRKK